MALNRWILAGLFVAWMGSLAEADVLLTWEFPHTLGAQPWHLTLIQTTTEGTTLQTRTLEALGDARCRQLVGAEYVEGETWCAWLLPCLPSGAYQGVLQAREDSPPSEPSAFGIQAPPCTLVDFDEALGLALPTRLSPPVALAPPLPAPAPQDAPSPVHTPEAWPPHQPAMGATDGAAGGGSAGARTPIAVEPGRGPARPARPTPAAPHPPAPLLFETVAVPVPTATEALTLERFVQAFAELARRYDAAMDRLVAEYNAVYDEVLAHPSPAGQRHLEDLYQRTTQRQQQIYDEATQAWERLYAAWQQFILTPAWASQR